MYDSIEAALKVTKTFRQEGIKTNVTLFFSSAQGLMVAKAGAHITTIPGSFFPKP